MVEETMPDVSFNEEILEDSEYSRKSEFSKATIIQSQISKCLELRSKDMKPGYITYIQGKPTVIPDSRKEYVGAVECLKNTLAPEIDNKMPDLEEIWSSTKKEIFDKFAYKERIGKKFVKTPAGEKVVWIYSDRIFIPQKGSIIMCHNDKPLSGGISYNPNGWDTNIDAYWDCLVEIADELYADLNRLIHKLDYFKGGTSM